MTIQAILKPEHYQAQVFDANAPHKTAAFLGCQKVAKVQNYMAGTTQWIFFRDEEAVLQFVVSADPQSWPMIVCGPDGSIEQISVSEWAERFQVLTSPIETHTEDTLFKVRDILSAQGFAPDQVTDAITELQNGGILFRERVGV